MDPALEEKQNEQNQERQSGGGISQGINTINSFVGRGFKNPLSGIGSKATVQAGKLAAQTAVRGLFATPVGWVILGIIVVTIIVFVIVFSGVPGGVPGAPASEPETIVIPTETPTPTPPAEP